MKLRIPSWSGLTGTKKTGIIGVIAGVAILFAFALSAQVAPPTPMTTTGKVTNSNDSMLNMTAGEANKTIVQSIAGAVNANHPGVKIMAKNTMHSVSVNQLNNVGAQMCGKMVIKEDANKNVFMAKGLVASKAATGNDIIPSTDVSIATAIIPKNVGILNSQLFSDVGLGGGHLKIPIVAALTTDNLEGYGYSVQDLVMNYGNGASDITKEMTAV